MNDGTETPQRIARLTPLADVAALIDARVAQVGSREAEITAAVGRIVAGDVTGALHPHLALALRDGFAVRSELTSDASSYVPALLPAAARIDVGEPLPSGTDAVASFETVTVRDGRAEVIAPVVAGDGVLPAGADADRQMTLLRQGTRLAPVRAAILAAAGVSRVLIREPRVRLASARGAGDAVIDAALDLIAAEIAAAGGRVLRDVSMDAQLDGALRDVDADAVIVIGGTGGGRQDASVRVLAKHGEVAVHGIAIAPGETAGLGFIGQQPALLVPGRLDAALAVWLLLGRRILNRLSGWIAEPPAARAKLARKVASPLGLAEVVPVRIRAGTAEPIASGYLPLSALAQADGWILIPPESEGYPPGTEVVIRPWP